MIRTSRDACGDRNWWPGMGDCPETEGFLLFVSRLDQAEMEYG
jgi:hypothetical protein